MINNYFKLFLFSFFLGQLVFGQQMPIDFSSSSDDFNVWGGTSFSTRPSPTDSNNTVGQFVRGASGNAQGFYIDLISPIDLDFQQDIILSFYAFDPNLHTILLKLESGENPDIQVGVSSSSPTNWIELTFDFTTVGGTGKYNRLVIVIDDGSTIPGTFLIDDITDGSTETLDVVYTDLVWADEFDAPGVVNSSNWHHQTQIIVPGVGWANNEEQHYTNRIDNSFVDNTGSLNIVAKRETFNDQGLTKNYTSARLNSKFAFTFGRIDVRAKLPAWDGTWPAIWTLGKNINEDGAYWDNQGYGTTPWPTCGEIDIMEHGLGTINKTSSALHTNSSSGNTVNYNSQIISDVATNWHIYSVNWSPNQITFLVDNVPFYTYNPTIKNLDTWPFFEDQFIILNVAMGGISGGIDPNVSSGTMFVDYVHVYQNTTLSTNEIVANKFKVFPNPTNSIVTIKTKSVIDFIEVYNVFGKLILRKTGHVKSINVENLNSGLYLLNIHSEGTKTVKKVVVN